MTRPILHAHEPASNARRAVIARCEPHSLRTYTPSQAVLARSQGIYHWTPDNRRLFDFTSGVLVANLGHNPTRWMRRLIEYMGWPFASLANNEAAEGFFSALPLTAYNAVTEVETLASARLVETLQAQPGGKRLEQVMWAASGSEAIQKALWATRQSRDMILATRFGFHGKKGLAGAVSGSEQDRERDERVRFVGFPMAECHDVSMRDAAFDAAPYRRELEALWLQHGQRLGTFITEPYLGGGGSYHPPRAYLRMVEDFCRAHDILFVLDEIQSNFGRTGHLFAFETYGLEPDVVVLGKGLGNGVPVAAAVGRADVFASLDYGEASDTWSANPLACAAVLATLDEFTVTDVLSPARRASAIIEQGLLRLKEYPFVANVRGEQGGMVWGVEMADYQHRCAADWANAVVLACYRGADNVGIHLLGPLAKKVIRIAPPLVIGEEEAAASMDLMYKLLNRTLE